MKIRSKLLIKIASMVIVAIMLMMPLATVAFAENQIGDIAQNGSLADTLSLGEDEKIDVIVEFTSPSLLELNARADDPYTSSYEQRLLSEQSTVLDRLGIVPKFQYTGVINAAAITATADEIRLLEQMGGVKDVYLSQTFEALKTDRYSENSISLSDMMGISSAIQSGYTGDGVLVAIIDSGITLGHEAFNNTKYVQNPALTSGDLIELGYSSGYYNQKIPFYCDYTSSASDFADASDHGSHVAGIIGGYAENEDGSVKFSGIAPGAQICAMRVLNEVGGGTDQMIIAALEDAYKLGVDIINISFGRDSGFRLGGDQYIAYDGIFENLENAGIMVVCSAGNLGSMAENTPRHVLDENCVDYGTLSLPAIYPGNIGVGSINNTWISAPVVTIGGQNYIYSDNAGSDDPLNFKKAFSGKTVDIAYFDNYGKEEDYVGVDVTGKIVAVKRGELSFTDKCKYASDAGAIGLIVINGANDAMGGMVINNQTIPAILVENGAAEHFPMTDYLVKLEYGAVNIADAYELSYFSAVGVTPDLEIGLDILGIGVNVMSVKSQTVDEYVSHSGTSMAAPSVAGTYALLYQALKEADASGEKSRADITSYIEDVTQSTATLVTDDFGNLYSPRFQGAGFIDFEKAVSANAYITTPLVCLGYDKSASGSISVEYELVNVGDEDINYTAKVSAITDSFRQISPIDYKNNVTPQMLDNSLYTYVIYVDGTAVASDGTITLPAGESIIVKLELKLDEGAAYILSSAFPYGYFLDGFVEFYDVSDPSASAIHGGYVSFVGDWLAGPAIEPLTLTDVMDWIHSIGAEIDEILPYFAAGHINANYSYTSLLLGDEKHYIGENPLANGVYIPSYSDRNAISASFSNADKVLYDYLYLYPSLLRSCKSVRYVVTNSETGEIYASESQSYVRKDIPFASYQHMGLSHFIFEPVYFAPNELGQISELRVPTGTEITVSIYTLLDHPDATERLETEFEITVDYTAPELYYEFDAETGMLTVKCTDSEYLAGIVLEEVDEHYNIGERVDSRIYADKTPGLEYTEVFDLSDYEGDSISITVSDYASNMVTIVLSLSSGSVSNLESSVTVGNGLSVDFASSPCVYQDVDFTVTPADGYCFTDAFVILVNGEELAPYSVENGAYSYSIELTEDELVITSVGALPHDFVPTVTREQTCVSDGELSHICSNCSYVGSVEIIPSSGHISGTAITLVEATCTEAGIATVSCTECGVILKTQAIVPHGHTEGEPETVREATCVDSGLKEISCSACGKILESEIINATGHKSGKSIVVIEATCSSSGLSAVYCDTCGVILSTAVIDQIGHTPGELVITKEATCTEAGLGVVKCTDCESILEVKIISAKGHDHTSGTKATAFSQAVCGICGESYGTTDSNGLIVLSIALSTVAILATIFTLVVVFIKKKHK